MCTRTVLVPSELPFRGQTGKTGRFGPNCFQRHHSGCVADLTQAKGQETVSASESSVILAGEPLFAALFSAICLGEFLGPMGYLGGALIVMGGLVTAEIFKPKSAAE